MTPAAQERAASAALYPTTSREPMGVRTKRAGGASTPQPTTGTTKEVPMSTNLQPELVERRRLIASLDPRTLQALSTHGDADDRTMARSEIRLRETNLFAGDPADSLIAEDETVRVCRHCGIGAPEAALMNEPWCPGRGHHSYVDTVVSRRLPNLLETGEGR